MAPPRIDSTGGFPVYTMSDSSGTDTVQFGEGSLANVAKRLGTDLASLQKANPQITNPNQLMAGQQINLPADWSSSSATHGTSPAATQGPQAKQIESSPLAGSLAPSWEGKQQIRSATIGQLVGQAIRAGVSPSAVPGMTAKLGSLPDAQFDRASGLLKDALSSVDPEERFTSTLDSIGKPQAANANPQLVEDYPIHQGADRTISSGKERVVVGYNGDSAVHAWEKHSQVNGSGLADYLSKINGGGPLRAFEKDLASQWDSRKDRPTVTPIFKIGSQGVVAYKVERNELEGPNSSLTTIYDRNGNKLSETGHARGEAETEDPIMDLALIEAGRGLGGPAGAGETGVTETVSKKVATSLAKTEAEAAGAGAAAEAGSMEAGAGADAAAGTRPSTQSNVLSKEGSGTSVHAKDGLPSKPPAAEVFSESEKQAIKDLESSGLSQKDAEQLIKEQREVQRVPSSPSWSGKPGPIGKKRYPY